MAMGALFFFVFYFTREEGFLAPLAAAVGRARVSTSKKSTQGRIEICTRLPCAAYAVNTGRCFW